MMNNKNIFVACDTSNIKEVKRIITNLKNNKTNSDK